MSEKARHKTRPAHAAKPAAKRKPTRATQSVSKRVDPEVHQPLRDSQATADLDAVHQRVAELEAREAEYRRAEQVQAALYRIADAASAVDDMPAFYAEMHRIVGELMYAQNLFIALYDAQSDLITWPYYVDTVDVIPPSPMRLGDHHGATGYVLRNGKTVADADGSWAAAMSHGEAHSVGTEAEGIAVPLQVENKTMGVILVQSYIKGIGHQLEDVKVLEFVAQHISDRK